MNKIVYKKNDMEIIKINAMSSEGNGISRLENNMTIFVPMTSIGDVVKVQVTKTKKNFAIGKVVEIITPSEFRIESDCPYFGSCGGCSYRHISYENELNLKKNLVYENIKRIGKLTLDINDILPSPLETRYRNKAVYQIEKNYNDEVIIGFYEKNSHKIINIDDCMLQPKIFKEILRKTKVFIKSENVSVYNKKTKTGLLRHLYIRYGEKTDEIMVGLVINGNTMPSSDIFVKAIQLINKNIKSVFLNINKTKTNIILGNKNLFLTSNKFINDSLLTLNIKLSPTSFYQVNRRSAENLYKTVLSYADIKETDIVLDLYCGVGTIGLLMAQSAKKVFGVDVVREAIYNAEKNAEINNVSNASFIAADVENIENNIKDLNPSIVVIDPPRKGSDEKTLKMVVNLNPKKIIMVSCDSATLARDLKYLKTIGYSPKKGASVDMFPRTPHVETIVLMSRVDK